MTLASHCHGASDFSSFSARELIGVWLIVQAAPQPSYDASTPLADLSILPVSCDCHVPLDIWKTVEKSSMEGGTDGLAEIM